MVKEKETTNFKGITPNYYNSKDCDPHEFETFILKVFSSICIIA